MGQSFRLVENVHLIDRPQDPPHYGFICASCGKRFGQRKPGGFIDITRCSKCPSLGKSEAEFYKNKRLKALGESCLKI